VIINGKKVIENDKKVLEEVIEMIKLEKGDF